VNRNSSSVRAVRCFVPTFALSFLIIAGAGADLADELTLKGQGSFFVGGRTVFTDSLTGKPTGFLDLGTNAGSITVDQMYVRYQIPAGREKHIPVVMIHGGSLSGTSFETTPDGRMGWEEYFLRKRRAVYVPDQVARARSGFDATTYNEVRLGKRPASELPAIRTASHEIAWTFFRYGPTVGKPFSNEQFPVEAFDEFAKQMIPDLNAQLPEVNPTWVNLSALAHRLEGAILMGHSEAGFFPERAALANPADVRGIISIETRCPTTLSLEQISILTRIPILVVFGDHLMDVPTYATRWMDTFHSCEQFIQEVRGAGGDATMLHLPECGQFGNSHMLMQDKNNLEVADLILDWINMHVENPKQKHRGSSRQRLPVCAVGWATPRCPPA
jgi:pimeloyl-ACP methyl ester carboxylesterase